MPVTVETLFDQSASVNVDLTTGTDTTPVTIHVLVYEIPVRGCVLRYPVKVMNHDCHGARLNGSLVSVLFGPIFIPNINVETHGHILDV